MDTSSKILGTFRLAPHLQWEIAMERVHNPLARAFDRTPDAAVLDFIAHEIAADREAKRRQLRARLASSLPIEV